MSIKLRLTGETTVTCEGREVVASLLDEDSVGGLLKRIAAIARALGAVPRETELVEVQPAFWAIEDLAHDAQARLRAAVQGAVARQGDE